MTPNCADIDRSEASFGPRRSKRNLEKTQAEQEKSDSQAGSEDGAPPPKRRRTGDKGNSSRVIRR